MINSRNFRASERSIFTDPPRVVNCAAATATELFPDQRTSQGEIARRYIQNLTGGRLYLSFNLATAAGAPVCDPTTLYHNTVEDGQLYDLTDTRERVCCYSVGGGPVSTTLSYRRDLDSRIGPTGT